MRLRLGDFTFDSDTRQLSRGREEVHLSPKAFELLRTLIDQRPRALSKNELHEHLWPATFVSEANLASLVAEIRQALGDRARRPQFIRTAHRFGYAFCGEATEEPTIRGASPGARVRGGGDAAHHGGGFCWLIKDGRRLPLASGENILGRDADVDGIRIDSPTVSRRHARIFVSVDGATLEDLDSKNGTHLRGEPVSKPVSLADGDDIRMGSVVLRFRMALGSRTATWSGSKKSL